MKKKEIAVILDQKVDALITFLHSHPDSAFDKTKREGKWTTGQHVEHLIKSSALLNKALNLPSFVLRWRFGKMNREERSYQGLTERYQEKLSNNPGTFAGSAPKFIEVEQKPLLIKQLDQQRKKTQSHLQGYSERKLSSIIIPHPLLGKLSIREMMYFTAYHTEHHHEILKEHY